MPENFERSAVQLLRKTGQEPFVLAVGMVGVEFVCVGGRGQGDGRGGDTNYMIMIEDENSVWLCKTEDFLQLRKKKMSNMSKKKKKKKSK